MLNLRQDVITERDYRNILATARDDGFAAGLVEGEAKGLAEGEARGKADVAKAMLSLGLSEDVILQATGLTEAELDRVTTPIGLDIKGETPAEIAISIAAQMILVRAERSGL